MAAFLFRLDGFQISDTRSHHEDTNIWGLLVKVNGQVQGPLIGFTGDVNNGHFGFNPSTLGPIEINPNDQVQVFFQMYNHGDKGTPNAEQLSTILAELHPNDPHADTPGTPSPDPNPGSSSMGGDVSLGTIIAIGKGIIELAQAIAGFFSGCDGLVAFDKLTTTGQQLANDVDGGRGTRTREINAKREQLGVPCNDSGSNYRITWSIHRA
jgi:hypothetical protein